MILTFDTPEVIAEIKAFNCLSTLTDKDALPIRQLFRTVIRILMTHLIGKLDATLPIGEIRDLG
jgi:hypothetical protein